jgi:hypothetical protein
MGREDYCTTEGALRLRESGQPLRRKGKEGLRPRITAITGCCDWFPFAVFSAGRESSFR